MDLRLREHVLVLCWVCRTSYRPHVHASDCCAYPISFINAFGCSHSITNAETDRISHKFPFPRTIAIADPEAHASSYSTAHTCAYILPHFTAYRIPQPQAYHKPHPFTDGDAKFAADVCALLSAHSSTHSTSVR